MPGGPPTVVRLPKKWWPEAWKDMKDPVCPLPMDLSVHARAGNGSDSHCEQILVKYGFVAVPECRSFLASKQRSFSRRLLRRRAGVRGRELTRAFLEDLAKELEFSEPEHVTKTTVVSTK